MEKFCLKQLQSMVILGGSSAIGRAMIERVVVQQPTGMIFATYRTEANAEPLKALQEKHPQRLRLFCLNPTRESEWQQLAQAVSQYTEHLGLIVNCIGTLHDETVQPEKSILQISGESLSHAFTVNATTTALMAKHFFPFCRGKSLTLIAALSAKVGSIEDNKLGGWYSYRASKAALNMILKTLALEFKNRNIAAMSLAIHPGTTTTPLSQPYLQHSRLKIHSPDQTADNILEVFENKTILDSGKFYHWDGSELPW